jgi:hypothetical protein
LPHPDSARDLPLKVTERPAWLRPAYARMALVSHSRHLAALEAGDTDTLVVATDWLLWQRCMRRGFHALHFEHFLADLPAERQPLIELPRRAQRWMHGPDGADLTRFNGVSLGTVYVRQMILATQAVERLWCGLDRLCREFSPRILAFFDLRGDMDMVEDAQKRQLVQTLVRRHGLELEDRFDPVAAGDPEFPNPLLFRPPTESRLRTLLRRAYTRAVSAASHLRWLMRGRPPKVLLLLDSHQIQGMISTFDRTDIAPVIDAGSAPKSWAFLREALRKGFVLSHMPAAELSRDDRRALTAIGDRLEAHWRAHPPERDIDAIVRTFARLRLVEDGSFAATARLANRMRRFLDRHAIGRVLVGDSDHAIGRVTAELCAARGIPVDESFNGIHVTDWPTPSRCGDGRNPPPLTRILAWGEFCRTWLKAIGSPVEMVVTGYPSLDAVTPVPRRHGGGKRALILPPYTIELDPAALSGTVGPALLGLVEELTARGFDEIRLKVHPGHANAEYYRTLLAEFGHVIEVSGKGSVRAYAEWADLVVGPPNTGAMAECLALARPYYAFATLPGAVDYGYMPFLRVFRHPAELGAALDEGWEPDCERVLAGLCAREGGPPASVRIWQALAGAVAARGGKGGIP